MADPRTINLPGSGTATQQYELAPGLIQYVQSVRVVVDNSAGGDARPILSVSEQSGVVIADVPQSGSFPASEADAAATWALGLTDDEGGSSVDTDDVLFNSPNTTPDPRYLDIPVNEAGPSGYWFNLVGQVLRIHQTLGALNAGSILLDVQSSNTAVTLSHDTAQVVGYTHLRLVSDSGDFVLVAGSGDGIIRSQAAGTAVRVQSHAGTDVLTVLDENAAVDLAAGKTFVVKDHLGAPLVTYTG